MAVERIEANLSAFDRVNERRAFLGRCLLEVAVYRPEYLGVPFELRLLWEIHLLLRGFDGLFEETPVIQLDLGLDLRVADVHMRMRQEVDFEFAGGGEGDYLLRNGFT